MKKELTIRELTPEDIKDEHGYVEWLNDPEDYEFLCALYSGIGKEFFHMDEALAYLEKNPGLRAINAKIARNEGSIAAVIVEPVRNDYPKDGFLKKRSVTAEKNIVLIFDEIIRGYLDACGKVFKRVAAMLSAGDDITAALRGLVCHSCFERLN